LVALEEEPSYIDGFPFERGPNVVLIHMAPIPGLGAAIDYTSVALSAPPLNVVSCLKPAVLYQNSFRVLLIPK
jgi:hypothetical protein